jgi:hypothetical protein
MSNDNVDAWKEREMHREINFHFNFGVLTSLVISISISDHQLRLSYSLKF